MSNYPLTLLYDESCPLCKLEIDNLRARNEKNLLRFVDISGKDFDPRTYGIPQAELMRIIHAIKPDNSIVTGVAVFRLAYEAIGLGWIIAPTGWPLLKPLFDWLYLRFADNRYRLSNRVTGYLFEVAARRAEKRSRRCKNDQCEVKQDMH